MSLLLPAGGATVTAAVITGTTKVAHIKAADVANAHTFSSVALGTATADRIVMMMIYCAANNTTPNTLAITIAGNTMNIQQFLKGNENHHMGIYTYPLAGGATTGDIVMTFNSGNGSKWDYWLWDFKGANETALDTYIEMPTGASSATIGDTAFNTVKGGFAAGIHIKDGGATTTWSGSAGMTSLETDTTQSGDPTDLGTLHDTAVTNLDAFATPSGSTNPSEIMLCSFQPA